MCKGSSAAAAAGGGGGGGAELAVAGAAPVSGMAGGADAVTK